MIYTIGDLLEELKDHDPDTPIYLDKTTPEVQRMGLFNLAVAKFVGVVDVPNIRTSEPFTRVCLFSTRDFDQPITAPEFLDN